MRPCLRAAPVVRAVGASRSTSVAPDLDAIAAGSVAGQRGVLGRQPREAGSVRQEPLDPRATGPDAPPVGAGRQLRGGALRPRWPEIKAALKASSNLKSVGYKVYAKGSYANNTNVRLDYDVDIALECTDFYYHDEVGAAADVKKAAVEKKFGAYKGGYTRDEFKNDVEQALVDCYGRSAVKRGNMAMRVREKKTTLPADVVPCFEYHYIYDVNSIGDVQFHKGTRIYPASDSHIHNWPEQQYERGVTKNDATGRRYKRMVRALKRLETHWPARSSSTT